MPLGGLTTAVTSLRFSTYEYRCQHGASRLVSTLRLAPSFVSTLRPEWARFQLLELSMFGVDRARVGTSVSAFPDACQSRESGDLMHQGLREFDWELLCLIMCCRSW